MAAQPVKTGVLRLCKGVHSLFALSDLERNSAFRPLPFSLLRRLPCPFSLHPLLPVGLLFTHNIILFISTSIPLVVTVSYIYTVQLLAAISRLSDQVASPSSGRLKLCSRRRRTLSTIITVPKSKLLILSGSHLEIT